MKIMFIVRDLGVTEPFGPMILSAILKQQGHETILGVINKEDLIEKIFSWEPDMLAYSMMSVDMEDMKKFNDTLRGKRKIFTILGGPATLDRNYIDDPGIDAICVGEGDEAIVDVVKSLENSLSLEGIPNIMKSKDSILALKNRITDLDKIPFMDREIVYSFPEMARFGIKGIWTSRGCPYPCPYCFNNRINMMYEKKGKVVRRRSVSSVISEIKKLVERYRVDFIRIQDDIFVHRVDNWLEEFAERYSSEIGIPFYCLLRCELVTEELVCCLKKAGCFSVCVSIETADDYVRNQMLRRRMSKEKMENAFRIFKKYKINVYNNVMLALPFTTLEQDIATLDFVIKVQPEMPDFTIFMPYPGTDLGDYCRNVGIYDQEEENIDYGMKNLSPLNCFSERMKMAQYNLCQLSIVAVKFPVLRNIIVNSLIYCRPNKLFFFIHYVIAVYSYGRKIFYFKHSFGEYFELVSVTIKHFLYDFLKKNKGNIMLNDLKGNDKKNERYKSSGRFGELRKCMEAMTSSNIYALRERD